MDIDNALETLMKLFNEKITVTNFQKSYSDKDLIVMIELNNKFKFRFKISNDMRKVLAYHLNDMVKMNLNYSDVKHIFLKKNMHVKDIIE